MLKPKYTKLDLILLKLLQGGDEFHSIECGDIIGESKLVIGRLNMEIYHLENDLKESESNGELNELINYNASMINLYTQQKNSFVDLKDNKRPVTYLI